MGKVNDYYYCDRDGVWEEDYYDTEPSVMCEEDHIHNWLQEMKENKMDILRAAQEWEEMDGNRGEK